MNPANFYINRLFFIINIKITQAFQTIAMCNIRAGVLLTNNFRLKNCCFAFYAAKVNTRHKVKIF
jgi:hypothetical protein